MKKFIKSALGFIQKGLNEQYGPKQEKPIRGAIDGVSTGIVCPICKKKCKALLDYSVFINESDCPNCERTMRVVPTIIRSKKSRGDKKKNKREFDVRVKNKKGNEELIQFKKSGYDDIPLSSGDIVLFNYKNGSLKVIQNLTVGKYYFI